MKKYIALLLGWVISFLVIWVGGTFFLYIKEIKKEETLYVNVYYDELFKKNDKNDNQHNNGFIKSSFKNIVSAVENIVNFSYFQKIISKINIEIFLVLLFFCFLLGGLIFILQNFLNLIGENNLLKWDDKLGLFFLFGILFMTWYRIYPFLGDSICSLFANNACDIFYIKLIIGIFGIGFAFIILLFNSTKLPIVRISKIWIYSIVALYAIIFYYGFISKIYDKKLVFHNGRIFTYAMHKENIKKKFPYCYKCFFYIETKVANIGKSK